MNALIHGKITQENKIQSVNAFKQKFAKKCDEKSAIDFFSFIENQI